MAKMKDDHFELVINIQRFTPEEVKVYLDGQAVIVMAKHETDGYVTGSEESCIGLLHRIPVNFCFLEAAENSGLKSQWQIKLNC